MASALGLLQAAMATTLPSAQDGDGTTAAAVADGAVRTFAGMIGLRYPPVESWTL